jgi:repressor LexA
MEMLTTRQREVFEFLRAYARAKGYPPTVREIRDEFKLQSNRGVIDHLRALERKGWIKRQHGISRAIEIIGGEGRARETKVGLAVVDSVRGGAETESDRGEAVGYPVAGKIAAGRPSPPVEESGERLFLDRSLFGGEEDSFILEVRGDSMIDDHIVPGDLLVVKRQATCEQGEIVVALVDGEATVKRYVCDKDGALLKPGNPRYTPIRLSGPNSSGGEIVGAVVGVIRRMAKRRRPFSR